MVSKTGDTHPAEVFLLLEKAEKDPEFFTGWVANFAGQVYPHNTIRGNGDLAGDVTWQRANVRSPGATKPYVRVFQPPADFFWALTGGIKSSIEEIAGLGQAVQDSRFVRQQLLAWNDLSQTELEQIIDRQTFIADLLTGARDAVKRQAAARIDTAVGVTDSRDRLNPSVTMTKHALLEPLLQKRQQRALRGHKNLVGRLGDAERYLWRCEVEAERHDKFLSGRGALGKADVDEFFDISRDTLKPLSQLDSWLCFELVRGGGQILDPAIFETARRALGFHRLNPRMLATLRVMSSLSTIQAETNSRRYQEAFRSEVHRLSRLLERLLDQIGGPYDDLVRNMYTKSLELQTAFAAVDWRAVIAVARQMRHDLIYRSTPADPAPEIWYGHVPPGSNPMELVMSFRDQVDPALLPGDAFAGLPSPPRGLYNPDELR